MFLRAVLIVEVAQNAEVAESMRGQLESLKTAVERMEEHLVAKVPMVLSNVATVSADYYSGPLSIARFVIIFAPVPRSSSHKYTPPSKFIENLPGRNPLSGRGDQALG